MNERIRELAEQAGAYCEDYKPPVLEYMDLEKFAELVEQDLIKRLLLKTGSKTDLKN